MIEIQGWGAVSVAAVATLIVLLLAFLSDRTKSSQKLERRLPPGPRGWPLLGCLPLLGKLPNQSLYELSKQYGPIMFMRLGSAKTLVVTSAKFAEEILKKHDLLMSDRPVQIVSWHISYNGVDIGCTPYGPQLRYLRKVVTVGLLTVKRLRSFQSEQPIDFMALVQAAGCVAVNLVSAREEGLNRIDEVREREVLAVLHFILEESQRGNAVNVSECFNVITMNNITQMMMNKSYCDLQSSGSKSVALPARSTTSLQEYFREYFTLLGAFNIADYVPLLKPFDPQGLHKRAKVLHRRMDEFLEQIIEEHRQKPLTATTENHRDDFIDALLGLGHTDEFEEGLSMDVVKAVLQDMLAAAGDTSSVTSAWALTELVQNPSAMRKAQDELNSVVGPHRMVQEEDLPKLEYLNAVMKETLRLHAPAPLLIPHFSTEDVEIEGFHVPAGTRVFVNLWGIHRDPAVWERPLEFNPDRFLNSTIDYRGQHFQFLPFGSGRRVCPGINLGVTMVLYSLAVLLHALDFTVPEGQKPQDVDKSETFGLVLFKRLPLTLFGKSRLPNHVIYGAGEVQT